MGVLQIARRIDETTEKQESHQILMLRSTEFVGDEMIDELRRVPLLNLGTFEVNFNSPIWHFPNNGESSQIPLTPSAQFEEDGSEDIWKLWLICSAIWGNSKIRTLVVQLNDARQVFELCGGTDARASIITPEGYASYSQCQAINSSGYRYSRTRSLLKFLKFRETYFGLQDDSDVISTIERDVKRDGRALSYSEGVPAIADSYLTPLIETCQTSIRNGYDHIRYRIVAAAILIATQVGMRVSELCALESGKLSISSIEGRDDITFLEFKTFKAARGDEGFHEVPSIMNHTALEAYLWLEENCAKGRERVGSNALIVTPEQKNAYIGREQLRKLIKEYILTHNQSIPCINTQGEYPEMQAVKVGPFAKISKKRPEDYGLDGSEYLVYPRFHSFRTTVATKLYESGVDLRYIKKHMGHLDENTTIGYIRSDREIEQSNNSLVYRAVFQDGAEFIGPHGAEFQHKIEQFVDELPAHVKASLDEIVAATSKAYPLRRKVGGVCIRCGRFPQTACPSNDETDQIYCAFGVCPNQCVLYFMADLCLDTVRSHMELVQINQTRGYTKAARNELRKAQNVMRDTLVPELDSLERQLSMHGRDHILGHFPELSSLIDTLPEVRKEIAGWQAMSI